MGEHLVVNDPKYSDAAYQILLRHDNGEPEANITSAVRGFLTVTGLAKEDEIIEENPPSDTSRLAVDLTALVVSQRWNQKGKGGEVWFVRPGC